MKHEHYPQSHYSFTPINRFEEPYKSIDLPRLGIHGWPATYDPTADPNNGDACLHFLGWGNPPIIFNHDLNAAETDYLKKLFQI